VRSSRRGDRGVGSGKPSPPDERDGRPESPAPSGADHGTDDGGDPGFPIVGIGASAGGLDAYLELFRALPTDTGMSFVVVPHLDPTHDSALGDILSRSTALPVHAISDGQRALPDHVHVLPPDAELRIEQGVLRLHPRPRDRSVPRPIDAFFESLAQDQRERAIGVILSGTANDGTRGLETIKAEGGITFAQDASAKQDSMPRSAIAAGVVDLVLSPAEMAEELARIARHPYGRGRPLVVSSQADGADGAATAPGTGEDGRAPQGAEAAQDGHTSERQAADGYRTILNLLRNHSGVDFAHYKANTIQRRISRRMVLKHHEDLQSYAEALRGNAQELDALYSDVLISVTSFFRNPEAFEALQREVVPRLLEQPTELPIRCWVLGCSTGQEAYSLAMAFIEGSESSRRSRPLRIFATDLNDALLERARHGLYPKSLAGDLSPERLRRFFTEEEGGYRVSKRLRDIVVFARHNLVADPPFSRMDLITCRNLLIYLEPGLQQRAIPTFHYALKPGHFLMLGASESIGSFTDLFEPLDKRNKLYVKKAAPSPAVLLPARRDSAHGLERSAPHLGRRGDDTESLRQEQSAQREADRITVTRFAPPAVLINDDLQVLQFRGSTQAYLQPPQGKASFNILKMAREGLMLPLRAAIQQARKQRKPVLREGLAVQIDGERRTVSLEVIPLVNLSEHCYLILFKGMEQDPRAAAPQSTPRTAGSTKEAASRTAELEDELAETRDFLQSMQEQAEATNEELQAGNEEVQSANEELQSINEELETSKEELESANEELSTLNALNEAQRVAHLGNWTWNQASNKSVVSDEFSRIFGLQPGAAVPEFKDQVERLYPTRSWQRLQAALRATLRSGVGFELDVEALRNGRTIWVTTRCEAIRDDAGAVVGLRGTVQDITERKQLEMELARKVEELAAQDRAKSDFLAVLSHELRNPLNAIRGWVTLLQRPDLKPENVRQGIAVIDRQSRAQAELIGDLLDVQRLNSGKVRLETAPVDLANVVHAAVEAIVPSATEKGIRVVRVLPEGETVVLGDANRLQQVIWNLLSNSLKFTPARGEIRLELRRAGAQAEVRLNDTGEGIAAEALPHIFERFRQADASSSRIHGGLGLGLAIARQLVELHGGRIHAESRGKGLGATFVVTLPLHSEVEALRRRPLTEQTAAGASRSLEGRVVLVVDDEVDAREPLRQVLEAVGAEVIAVGSVDEALAVVERQRPEIIVSDIAMPARDGYELMRSVRSLPCERGGRTPVVALTAFATAADRERALGAGFSAHLGKPVEAARLVQVISSLVSLPLH
jgi:two-component system CheB/CheR fusion protein